MAKSNNPEALKSGKEKLQKAVNKFRRAIKTPKGINPADTVRIRIGQPNYFEEVTKSKFSRFNIVTMGPEELKKSQLSYDDASQMLLDSNLQPASTIGTDSKNTKDALAFVMDKDGNLYVARHSGQLSALWDNVTHGSFLDRIPAEMAGIIKIHNGKITEVTDQSGHYEPDELDMYRFIKRLGPNVFTPDAEIKIFGNNAHPRKYKVKDFIKQMEQPGIGKDKRPKHQKLRDERLDKRRKQSKQLNNTAGIVIDIKDRDELVNVSDVIANLPTNKQQELSTLLNNPISQPTIFFKDPNPKNPIDPTHPNEPELIPYTPSDLTNSVIDSGNTKAMQVLLNSGIGKRKDLDVHILHTALSQNNHTEMSKMILKDRNIREILKKEVSDIKYFDNSLASLVKLGEVDLVKEVLKYPEGQELFKKQNAGDRLTPLQIAKKRGDPAMLKVFEENNKLQNEKFEQLKKEKVEQELKVTKQEDILRTASNLAEDKVGIRIMQEELVSGIEVDIFTKLYHQTFKKDLIKTPNAPFITAPMLAQTNDLLYKAVSNYAQENDLMKRELTGDDVKEILPKWHELIIKSDDIAPEIKSYVIANNAEARKQIGIPTKGNITVSNIYDKLVQNQKEKVEQELKVGRQEDILTKGSSIAEDKVGLSIVDEGLVDGIDLDIFTKLYHQTFKKDLIKTPNAPFITESMLDQTNDLLYKAISNYAQENDLMKRELTEDDVKEILPKWHELIIKSDDIAPEIKSYVIANNAEARKQIGIPTKGNITVSNIYDKLVQKLNDQQNELDKIKDQFDINKENPTTTRTSRTESKGQVNRSRNNSPSSTSPK